MNRPAAPVPVAPQLAWDDFWHSLAAEAYLDPTLAVATRHGFVLDPAERAALGITRAMTRTRVGHGEWTGAGRGYVAPLRAPTPQHVHALRAAAAVRRRTDDVVSGRSCAVLYGLPVVALPEVPQTTRAGAACLGPAPGAHRYGAALRPDEISTWYGVPLTTMARTLVDLGRHDRFDAIMAVDAALSRGLVQRCDIDEALASAAGWPGVQQAREVLALGDPLAESALESVTRLRLHDDGFPPPQLQTWIAGYRVDLYWPEFRLVLEVDGRVKYDGSNPDVLWEEKTRQLRIQRADYRVERVIARDVYGGWPATAARLRPYFALPQGCG